MRSIGFRGTPVLSYLGSLNWLIVLTLAACQTSTQAPQSSEKAVKASEVALAPLAVQWKGKKESLLTEKEANLRSQQVGNVRYDLEFDFSNSSGSKVDSETYQGRATIRFDVKSRQKDLRVDFDRGEITTLALNGQDLKVSYNGDAIWLPAKKLSAGANTLTIRFRHLFSHSGQGISKFVDPVDQKTYLSSQFEAYYANQAFPCFDQPDLKAEFTTTIKTPLTWEAISMTRESSVTSEGQVKTWKFPVTKPVSTYVFSLHAGDFVKWEDNFRIPLRLFARASIAKNVKVKEWFAITRYGLDFYEKYFATPYPFGKYDQLLIPEFNAGAMENAGAVTFSEHYVSRGEQTKSQVRRHADVVLHEMAHMWFGDLVTMKWWGDLWLNESFATFMSYRALSEHPDFKEAWAFFFGEKSWAYYEDQLPTTHPISDKVSDTAGAFASFDGITYGKGASVIKQLNFLIGEPAFQAGVASYFKSHAFANAEFKDFIGAIESASKRKLETWKTEWFAKSGLNQLTALPICDGGKLKTLTVEQKSVSGSNTLRTHALQIGLYSLQSGKLQLIEKFKTEVSGGKSVVKEATGKPCPAIVFLNEGDHGYFREGISDLSLKGLLGRPQEKDLPPLIQLEDPLLRLQVWNTLWSMVRDAQLSLVDFGRVLPLALSEEKEELHQTSLVRNSRNALGYFQKLRASMPGASAEFAKDLEARVWKRLLAGKTPTNDPLVWFDAAASLTSTPEGIQNLKSVLSGQKKITGINLDQDRRWAIVQSIARYSSADDKEVTELILAESKKDPSSRGEESKIAAEAARPSLAVKKQWLQAFKQEKLPVSFAQLREASWHLLPPEQDGLRDQLATEFYANLEKVATSHDDNVATTYTNLAPSECRKETAGKLSQFVQGHKSLPVPVVKEIKGLIDEGDRCRRIGEKALGTETKQR